jgi:riboflavin biosynthesis pyrimidine reductase
MSELPLEVLFERSDLPRFDLPEEISSAYGGSLGFDTPCVIANFVTSKDGVVALAADTESGALVSGGSDADHFVMGLLRACADVVMVGAGTFRKAGKDGFDAASIYPSMASSFEGVRKRLTFAPRPRFVVVTASGAIEPAPVLDGGLVLTTGRGAPALRARVSASTQVVALSPDRLRMVDVVAFLRSEGARIVLSEGGPSLFAELVGARAIDELFVTTSPRLFGRFAGDGRKSLADGLDLGGVPMDLLSLRRTGSYLFTRYALPRKS